MARHFPDWLKAYCDYTMDMESPLSFHFWTGIATIAAALRRRVWIDMRKFVWTPNFYIILVAPAGIAAKSTSISIGTSLLAAMPKDAGVRFGPESMTWQKLADSLSASIEHFKYIDEKGKDQLQPMSALTCAVSELGTFLTMDDDKLLSFLIRMWDGGDISFVHSTKASGDVEVKSPWLNVIAATTPTWLSANFPAAMIGGGLASRILFVHNEAKRHYVPYPDEVALASDYLAFRQKLIDDLVEMSLLAGPYSLLEEARAWGRDWYINLHKKRPQHLSSDKFSGYLARKQTHVHKVAMIVAASRRNELIINRNDLETAEKLVTALEFDMKKTFDSIGQNDVARAQREIRSLIDGNGPFIRHDDLVSQTSDYIRTWMLKEAIDTGVQSGLFAVGKAPDGTLTYSVKRKIA